MNPKKNMTNNNRKTGIITGVTAAIAAIMIIFWALQLGGDQAPRVWRAFLINYLFFTSLAAGLVVWPAIIVTAGGDWMGPLEKVCWAGFSFSVPSLLALIVLWAGSQNWVPWLEPEAHHAGWLNNTFLFARNLIMQLLFWFLAWLFLKNRRSAKKHVYGGWLVFVYALTFSLVGFDLIMPLDLHWKSMVVGSYYFVSSLYLAAAAWAFISIISGKPDTRILRTIGKLVFAFCLLTTYLMFSQLLPSWYENQPHMTSFIIPRYNFAWVSISYLLLVMVYLGPIPLLVSGWSKRNPVFLGVVSAMILAGMWIERWWLVDAVYEKDQVLFGWPEISPTLGFLALMITAITLALGKIPRLVEPDKIQT